MTEQCPCNTDATAICSDTPAAEIAALLIRGGIQPQLIRAGRSPIEKEDHVLVQIPGLEITVPITRAEALERLTNLGISNG